MSGQRGGATPSAAPVPRGGAPAGYLGLLLALLLAVLGVLLLLLALALAGWAEGLDWLVALQDAQLQIGPSVVLGVVAAAAVALGAWLVVMALRPARSRGVRVGSGSGVWMHHRDVERVASAAAEQCSGVLSARSRGGGRRVSVAVEATSAAVRDDVRRAVSERLAPLRRTPRVGVRVKVPFEEAGS